MVANGTSPECPSRVAAVLPLVLHAMFRTRTYMPLRSHCCGVMSAQKMMELVIALLLASWPRLLLKGEFMLVYKDLRKKLKTLEDYLYVLYTPRS